jgi:hypothetical protein
MSVIATSTSPVSPFLILGAAGVLLGSVFTMVAPTPYYQPKERVLKRTGRIVSFSGALMALIATTTQGQQPAHGIVAFAALIVVEAVMVCLLAPVLWRSLRSILFSNDEDDEQKSLPQDAVKGDASSRATVLAEAITTSILALLAWRRLRSLLLRGSDADKKRDN